MVENPRPAFYNKLVPQRGNTHGRQSAMMQFSGLFSSAAAAAVNSGFWRQNGVSMVMTLLAAAVLGVSLVLAIRTTSR